jgi:hypothetical protein
MVGVVQTDPAIILRVKELLLEGKGSIIIERIIAEEVKNPTSPIYGKDPIPYGTIERSLKSKLRTRASVNGVPGITKAEWKKRGVVDSTKVTKSDYLEMKEYIKKNPDTTRVQVAEKWGVRDVTPYDVEKRYSKKHGKLNWKVLKGSPPIKPYVTENAEAILKVMKDHPELKTGTKIRDKALLSVGQFNSAMTALKSNTDNRFDIPKNLVDKIKKLKGGTIRTTEDILAVKKIITPQEVKTIFTEPRIALREFFAGGTGTVFEHSFPRTLINKKFDGKHLFDKATRDAFEVIGTRTSPYLNFAKVKIDNLQRGLVNDFLADKITLDEYRKGINEIRTQFKNATGGYEIGYIDFDKNKNPTPVTKLKKVTLPKGQWGPGTAQKITPFANAKYTANLLNNYLENPGDDIFSSLRRSGMDLSKISRDTVQEYESLASAYKQAKPHLYNTQKFANFANIEMKKDIPNPVVRALLKAEQSVKSGDTEAISIQRLKKRFFGPSGRPELGLQAVIEAATRDDNNICQAVFGKKGAQKLVFGKQHGGTASGCGPEMKRALQETPEQTLTKITEVGSSKLKNAARGLLTVFGRFGPAAGKYGAIAAAGALAQPLVKQFRNDDPSTWLTDENQQAGMLDALIEGERPKPRSEILDWSHTAGTLGATAAAVPGTGALWKARRLPTLKRAGMGMPRAALGPAMKLVSGMFTPAGLMATEPLRIAQKRREGESWGEIGTDPTLWMGPAFAPSMTRMATRGMNPASLLPKLLRLGMSRAALAAMGPIGWVGLAASLGWEGRKQYSDYKSGRGFFASDEE